MPSPPPSSSNPPSDVSRKRASSDPPASDASLKRQKAIEEKLNEEGTGKPTLADLQACLRVGQSGLALLEELQRLMAGEMTARLQGKISALKVENRYHDGVLARVTRDLYTYRDQNLTAFSEDNRGLKEEMAKLKGVEEKLDAANKRVLEQKQKLEKLPGLEAEINDCRKRADDAKAKG